MMIGDVLSPSADARSCDPRKDSFSLISPMSALWPKADIPELSWHPQSLPNNGIHQKHPGG